MKDLNILTEGIVNSKITLSEYIKRVKNIKVTKDFLLNYNKTDLMDQRMNALLILYFFNAKIFNEVDESSNPYLKYIKELTIDISNYEITFLYEEENFLIIKQDNFYFIINHNNFEIEKKLPNELQNKTIFCYNCNDDLQLEKSIILPEFSFYALENL